jgi:hypothetical protein
MAWFFGVHPLEQARAGAQEVDFSIKAFVAAPLFIVAGLALMLGGRPVAEAFSGPPVGKQQHAIVWTTFGIGIAASGAAFWYFQNALSALGYR